MGTRKKEAARKERQGQTGSGMGNVKVKGENFYRNAKKVKTLNMYKQGEAQRNASGKITKAAPYQSRTTTVARVEPNRKWFNNTRVISQQSLDSFRSAVASQTADPFSFLLKQNKLPMSLIRDDTGKGKGKGGELGKDGVREFEAKRKVQEASFGDTFGPKARRKRVKLSVGNVADMAKEVEQMEEKYVERLEEMRLLSGNAGQETTGEAVEEVDGVIGAAREPIFNKGQSKRIWNELYKVIDASDVIIHVLDARDPLGTRCHHVEKFLREEAPHKHLVFILNKIDLVPNRVAATWLKHLSASHPTLAFRSSLTNPFGKGSLISLLRQFSALHSNRRQISVGFIGYPNTGKSSIINTLRKKRVCTVAPVPGETKIWQYVTLMKRIYLIDCPGVVPPSVHDTEEDILLRGVVRVENVDNPSQYVAAALKRCARRHIERTYDVSAGPPRPLTAAEDPDIIDADAFLERLARRSGRLFAGAEPDVNTVARGVLHDFLRGKLPWYQMPPGLEDKKDAVGFKERGGARAEKAEDDGGLGLEGRKGRLGEMGRMTGGITGPEIGAEVGDDSFGGFSDDEDPVEDEEDEVDEDDEDDDDNDDDDATGSKAGTEFTSLYSSDEIGTDDDEEEGSTQGKEE